MGHLSCPIKIKLSGFCVFNPSPCVTYPFTLISYPLSRTAHGEPLGPLGGDFLAPQWNLPIGFLPMAISP
jgi:hypothetical protein